MKRFILSTLFVAVLPAAIFAQGRGGGGVGNPFGGGTIPGLPANSTATGPIAMVQNNGNGATVNLMYNPKAATSLGTGGESDFLVQVPGAINIPPNIRVFQNNRDAAARGQIIPVTININAGEGLQDMLADYNRQRLYITNSGMNEIEVYDMVGQKLLTPIKAGQLPHNMAFGTDGNTLYVANTGGESISMIDLTQMKIVGSVVFPPIPLNTSTSIITPQAMASSLRGPLVIMSDGSLWSIVGNQAVRRNLNAVVFGGATTISGGTGTTSFHTMAATPEGEYVLVFAGTGNAYIYDATADDFTIGKQIFSTLSGYEGPISAGPQGKYYIVDGVLLNSSLTPIGNVPSSTTSTVTTGTTTTLPGLPGGVTTTTTATRPISAVSYISPTSYAVFSNPVRTSASSTVTDAGMITVYNVTTGLPTSSASALEGPASVVTGNTRTTIPGRTMAFDSTGSNAYVLTVSGLSVIPMTPVPASETPKPSNNGTVNLGNYQSTIAPGSLIGIFGSNLASQATASTTPLTAILGGTCVTLNNQPLPLLATSSGQINAQIPPTMAAGRYPLVVHSIANQVVSTVPVTVTVAKYAPAVLVDSNGQAAIYHSDGKQVTPQNPTTRDQKLTMYATGLGVTSGGTVTTGNPAPSNPLAVTAPVSVYFGPSNYSQSAIAVEWSGLVPGMIGVYQIDLYVPGTHMDGNALPVMIKIGGVSSPVTGSVVPTVAVN